MNSLKTNQKYKDQQKRDKIKAKEQLKKEKLLASRLKQKERKLLRKERVAYNRFIKKCKRDNPTIAKMIAKIRDGWKCTRCGSKKNIHGSHIICEKRDHRLASDPDNIKALCYSCHFKFRHKHPIEAVKWLEEKFPGRMDMLWERYRTNQTMGTIGPIRHEDQNKLLRAKYKEISGEDWK